MSSAIAALVAHVAFWALLAYGLVSGELTWRRAGIFFCLWLAGRVGLALAPPPLRDMFTSFVAILDIVLVFIVFKGDVRIT